MLKGTRMIVVTKENIVKASLLVGLIGILIIFCGIFTQRGNIKAFSAYEKIFKSEIVPAEEKNKNVKDTTENYVKILKSYFFLGDVAKEKTPKGKIEVKTQEPTISSESLTISKGIAVSNNTNYSVDPQEFFKKSLSFKIDDSGPQVLIMHTHTTESFSEEAYIKGSPDRNLDENKNITAVGMAIEKKLTENGIKVVHDKTVHDYPSYNSAYQSAEATIRKNLEKHKGIKVVLDIHRDGITREDGTKVKLVSDINGEKTAQIMLVVGTDTNLPHENWRENFKLASKIQVKGEEMFPTLMRPIDLRKERFNEQLTLGSLIVEVGSNGNTLEEAINGGERIAEVISAVLKSQ